MTEAQLDVQALYAALDAQRKSKEISWREVATQAKVSPSTLTRLGQGKRPDVDGFAALVHWLGVSPEMFLRAPSGSRKSQPALMTVISTHLRAHRQLSPASAKALEEIIRAAYDRLKTSNAK